MDLIIRKYDEREELMILEWLSKNEPKVTALSFPDVECRKIHGIGKDEEAYPY